MHRKPRLPPPLAQGFKETKKSEPLHVRQHEVPKIIAITSDRNAEQINIQRDDCAVQVGFVSADKTSFLLQVTIKLINPDKPTSTEDDLKMKTMSTSMCCKRMDRGTQVT